MGSSIGNSLAKIAIEPAWINQQDWWFTTHKLDFSAKVAIERFWFYPEKMVVDQTKSQSNLPTCNTHENLYHVWHFCGSVWHFCWTCCTKGFLSAFSLRFRRACQAWNINKRQQAGFPMFSSEVVGAQNWENKCGKTRDSNCNIRGSSWICWMDINERQVVSICTYIWYLYMYVYINSI